MDNKEYLREKAFEGLIKRGCVQPIGDARGHHMFFREEDQAYINRLEEELAVINDFDFEDFILDVSYLSLLCKSKGILLGDGRGSVGGSLVAYVMGITNIDPLKYDLSFARFLNKGRISGLPDIDIDVSKKQRQEVIQLMKEEFGEESTYQFVNIIRFTEKTALKDLARIFNVPFDVVNRITAKMDSQNDPEVCSFLDKYPTIKRLYPKLIGLVRGYGVHAGGVILTPDAVERYTSLTKVNGLDVISYDKRILEDNLFLKQDLLGLNTLSIIQDTLSLIGVNDFEEFDYDLDDPMVYKTINESTLGIFQLEGAGASEYTYKMKPSNFDEVAADLALVRPGAQDSGDADTYLDVKEGRKELQFDHPLLEPILKSTMGAIVYQEQAMQIAKTLAGFTDSEADILRKGIGKKLEYIFTEYKPKFIEGCIKNNIDEDIANTVWDKIEKSASYSFNKSHSVGYALVTYKTAYLKTYYPIEFYLAMLNNIDDEDKRTKIYNEMKSINKIIKNPDINISKSTMINQGNDVYLSFSLVKGVGDKAVEDIVEKQPYTSFTDFMERKDSRKVNKRVVTALIEAGAFDCFTSNRAQLMSILDPKSTATEWSEEERLFKEYSRLKINPSGNLLDLYDTSNYDVDIKSVAEVSQIQNECVCYMKVIVSQFKNRDEFGFLSVTDNFDSISVNCSKHHIEKYIDVFKRTGTPILIKVGVYNGKAKLLNLIDLKNINDYKRELSLIDGSAMKTLQALKEKNKHINVGIIDNISFFTSKKGNRCASYNIILNENDILEKRMICMNWPENFEEGAYIFFWIEDVNQPFVNIHTCA